MYNYQRAKYMKMGGWKKLIMLALGPSFAATDWAKKPLSKKRLALYIEKF